MRFAKWLFLVAGISGVLLVAPAYFLEDRAAEFDPPPIEHPEHYYGFVGVVLVWQFVYLLIASDPIRFRPLMLFGALGKTSFAAAVAILYTRGRVAPFWIGPAAMDATLVVLFLIAYVRTAAAPQT